MDPVMPLDVQSDSDARIAELERQLEAQRQTNNTLVQRVAKSLDIEGGAFSLFERNSVLQQHVEQRTSELEASNRQLRQEVADRRMIEQALRFSEERYRFLLESTEQPFLVVRDFNFAYANPAAARLLGFDSADALIEAGLESRIPQDSVEVVRKRFDLRLAGESIDSLSEQRFLRRDGSIVHCDVNAHLGEFDGAPAVLISIHDITDRKEAAAQLAMSLSLLKATLESTADGVMVIDNAGKLVTHNRKFVEMWRLPEDVVATGDVDQMRQYVQEQLVDPEAFNARIVELYADLEHPSFELLHFRDGRAFERFSQPQRVDGISVGRVWSFRDITERLRAEEAMRESEERFRRLVEASPDFIMTLDEHGTVVFINRTADGTPADQVMGAGGLDYVKPEYHEAMADALRHVYTRHELAEVEFESPEGRWYFARMTPVQAHGQTTHAMAIVTDITERKRAEEQAERLDQQLRQAQKMEAIGTLAGGIAHDFNNILYAIQGYAELVLDHLPPGSPAAVDQQEVLVGARRAGELVRQILSFSRQSKSHLSAVQVDSVATEVLGLLRATLPTTITIERSMDASGTTVRADSTQLHQVLMNLCTNAAQAMPGGGTLALSLATQLVTSGGAGTALRSPGSYVVLRVRDTGCGIRPENLDRIFEPFFTTKDVGQGTGMGLSTVHGIITAFGGDIQVHSEVGVGTEFEVWLPQIEPEAVTENPVAPEEAERGSERIMFIDDEPAIARMGSQLLEHLGYRVEAFTSSLEAWERFEADPRAFDLVITDQTMPDLTGADLATRMLARRPDLPIMLCTGYSETINEESALALGLRAYLAKPVGIRDLSQAIRHALDQQALSVCVSE